MKDLELEQAVLQHVAQPDFRPVKPRVIAKAFGLSHDRTRELKKAIKRLVKRGKLAYGAAHVVGLPQQIESGGVTGVFRRMSAGYGFVRPEPARANGAAAPAPDIYISARNAGDASTGDTVLVRLRETRPKPGRPGPAGVVTRVLDRETHQFVGTYFEQGGLGLVEVDGKIFTNPILVGDPGAKRAQVNDKVVVEMVRFPSHVHEGEAVLVDVLGASGEPGVDTQAIIVEFGLPGKFAKDALAEARAAADAFDESISQDRLDLTGQTVITIDPEDARDFDDAISLDQLDSGHWRLGVHIADVTHFVRPKTALDREARDRATSVYLPDRVIPMLPEVVSNNLASLQPDRVRYSLTALLEFTADGVLVDTQLHKTAIRSARRFTYEEVDDYLRSPAAWGKKLPADVHALVGRMHRLAMILRRRRLKRGALELSMPEIKIDLDERGEVVGAHRVENTESHQIIEEFMLAANEAVAAALQASGINFLRRIHAAPDPRKTKALSAFVAELGIRTESLESRFALQKLLADVHGMPHQHAVNYAVLRSMQKAVYSPQEEGHYALASDCYCHFTSPIRRYPDLTVHRLLAAHASGSRPGSPRSSLPELGIHCSERERRAESAERELIKVKLLNYMSSRIGEEMDAVVTGVERFGLFVQGTALPAEGLIHVSSLSDDSYRFDQTTHTLAGYGSDQQFRLGDALRVAVAHVDVGRRELDFRLVARLDRAAATAPPKASPKKPKEKQKQKQKRKRQKGTANKR